VTFTFAHPWVLLFLAVPLLLGVAGWRSGGHRVPLPLDGSGAKRGVVWRFLLGLAGALPAALLAIAVALLAGPQQLDEPRTKRALTNIQFCLDVSGSMSSQFGDGDRYDAAMESINEFIDYRDGDAFGLTVFGGHFLHWIRLTSDPSAFRHATAFLGPRNLPPWFSGGTAIGMALRECLRLLVEREEGDRMIILVSDGYSGDLSGGNDEAIGRRLAANDVVVYAIHVAEGGVPGEIATIASITGGEVFAAGDPEALEAVFRRIDEMQETKLERVGAESIDNFVPLSLAGLGTLGLYALTLLGFRYTPW
jgi:Ca-activated chloride channel family protein